MGRSARSPRWTTFCGSPGGGGGSCVTNPRVVIVGGGFAGLYAAQGLADAPVEITLIDRQNHHLFQPMLYQVATAALSPSDIASPIRSILRNQKNTEVILGEVADLQVKERKLALSDGG